MNSRPDPPDSSTLPESLRILQLLWNLNAALQRTSLDMESRLGVTGRQRLLLRFVGLVPGMAVDRLTEVISADPSTVLSDLNHLAAKNLIMERRGTPGYYLTADGAAVNGAMAGTVEHAISKASEDASAYERHSFRRMLERIIDRLGPLRSS